MAIRVKTPCIGVCSTGIGDSVCRGCKRYMHEVASWNGYTEDERVAISLRLDKLLVQVLESRIEVFDEALLLHQLQAQRVRYHHEQSSLSWVFSLIKAGASQITRLEDFGARVLPAYKHMSLVDLKKMVDEDFFVLSTVHYERYFSSPPNTESFLT